MEESYSLSIKNGILTGYGGTLPETLAIPEGVADIGTCALGEARTLKSLLLPASVRRIEAGAFYGCESLSSVVFPDTDFTLCASAFEGCISLLTLEVPERAHVEGNFSFCAYHRDVVTVPKYVTNIEQNVRGGKWNFFDCRAVRLYSDKKWNVDLYHSFASCGRIELIDPGTDTVKQCVWIEGCDTKRWGKWGVHRYLTDYVRLTDGAFCFSEHEGQNFYDAFVPTLGRVSDKSLAMLYRLRFPVDLSGQTKILFEEYLQKNKKQVLRCLVDNDDPGLIETAERAGILSKRNRPSAVQYAESAGKDRMAACLRGDAAT